MKDLKTFSDLLLTMYGWCFSETDKQQADALIDAKVVLDHYLETKSWPDFWVYYKENGTENFIDKNFPASDRFHYARNVCPDGILVKYSFLDVDGKYLATKENIEEMRKTWK